MAPKGWKEKTISEIFYRVNNPVDVDLNSFYKEIGIRSHGKGIFHKEFVKGKSLGNKRVFHIEPNCFVVNIVFAWEQAIAKTTENEAGMIASHRFPMYKPKHGECDVNYILYFFNTKKGKYLLELASPGGAGRNKTLGQTEFSKIKMQIPPIAEQKKIAKILSTWDKAIGTTEQLLTNSQQQKKALMQQLLIGKKRFPGFSDEWQKVELGRLLDYQQPTPYLVKSSSYSNAHQIPVLTAGKTFILGYTNEDFGIFNENLPVIIFDDFTTASKFVSFPFKAKSSAMKILVAKEGISIKYVFEAMQVLNYPIGGHQRHWISIFANLVIGLPSIKEQQKIASILSTADKEIENLQKQLEHLKQEKMAIMQQLLTGKRRVKI
ncbi:MAG: restriction endonuclease subunit S [Legionellaceae bacterium]|nr:restriction endonuclease subunit S [Legionellaceae bacterium]